MELFLWQYGHTNNTSREHKSRKHFFLSRLYPHVTKMTNCRNGTTKDTMTVRSSWDKIYDKPSRSRYLDARQVSDPFHGSYLRTRQRRDRTEGRDTHANTRIPRFIWGMESRHLVIGSWWNHPPRWRPPPYRHPHVRTHPYQQRKGRTRWPVRTDGDSDRSCSNTYHERDGQEYRSWNSVTNEKEDKMQHCRIYLDTRSPYPTTLQKNGQDILSTHEHPMSIDQTNCKHDSIQYNTIQSKTIQTQHDYYCLFVFLHFCYPWLPVCSL